jgi:hypothetical protein
VQQNPPSDSSAAFDQKDAASLANEDDLTPLPKIEWLTRYNTFHRRIQEVTECHELTDAINFLQEASKLKDGGKDQTIRIDHESKALDEVIEKTKDVLDNAGEECKGKKSEKDKFTNGPCTLQLIRKIAAGATPFYKELQTQLLQVYGQDVLVKGQSDIQNTCKPGYSIVGGAPGLTVNDQVCDITREFSVRGAVLGGEITIIFTPNAAAEGELPDGGSYTYSGYGASATADGKGSFSMLGKLGSPVILKASGPGEVHNALGTAGASAEENYMLTPVEYACARN